ncbi:MAG: hypothetical protein F6K56_29900, partial [Moorea sp. SIO3G5]|nr:hypothetical protein [Moorena sp. SIO3G5]
RESGIGNRESGIGNRESGIEVRKLNVAGKYGTPYKNVSHLPISLSPYLPISLSPHTPPSPHTLPCSLFPVPFKK